MLHRNVLSGNVASPWSIMESAASCQHARRIHRDGAKNKPPRHGQPVKGRSNDWTSRVTSCPHVTVVRS